MPGVDFSQRICVVDTRKPFLLSGKGSLACMTVSTREQNVVGCRVLTEGFMEGARRKGRICLRQNTLFHMDSEWQEAVPGTRCAVEGHQKTGAEGRREKEEERLERTGRKDASCPHKGKMLWSDGSLGPRLVSLFYLRDCPGDPCPLGKTFKEEEWCQGPQSPAQTPVCIEGPGH